MKRPFELTDFPDMLREDLEVGRHPKRQRLEGPPVHTRSFLVQTTLEWKEGNETRKVNALLMLDSGASGAVLAQHFIDKHKIPLVKRVQPTQIYAANGKKIAGGTHYTTPVDMWIGKHVNKMNFDVLGLPDEGLRKHVGYMPMSWLTKHNPDIDWTLGTIKWRSTYCRKHCLPSTIKIEWMTEEQMLR